MLLPRINYSVAVYRANQIDELSHRLRNISNDISLIASNGWECWRGESATAYYNSCTVLENETKVAAENMADFSSTILQVAAKIITLG